MKKIYILMFLLFMGLWALAILFSGVRVAFYFNMPCIIIVVGGACILSLCTYSPAEIIRSFSIAFAGEKGDRISLKNGILFFKALQSYFILSGIIGFFIGTIAIMSAVEDKSIVGRGFAIALLTILYSLVLMAVVTIPFKIGLQKRLNELDD